MIKLDGEDNRRDYVLDTEEKEALLEAALKDSNAYIWLFIKLGLATGLRHSEMLAASFESFDEKRRRLRVRAKGGKLRDQPLTRSITEILSREQGIAADPDGWIFPSSQNASGHIDSMKSAFRRVVKAAGLNPKKITPHTMRHSAITDLAETGASAKTIQAFSGHTSKEMVWRYTHARDQRIDHALELFDDATSMKVEQLLDRDWSKS